jgi:hypothetical protein
MDIFGTNTTNNSDNAEDKLNKVITGLQGLTEQVITIKDSLSPNNVNAIFSSSAPEPLTPAAEGLAPEPLAPEPLAPEPLAPMSNNALQTDKNKKYYDGVRGRVSLSLPRIIMLIKNNIGKNTNKQWGEIVEMLNTATSVDQVQNIINEYKLSFSSNSIGGTRKKRRGGKRRRTSKKY